jgi:hypothetical protein
MMSLLNNGSMCENVISRLVIWAEIGLTLTSEMTTLQIVRKSLMQSYNIKFGEYMSHHDSLVIVCVIAQFVARIKGYKIESQTGVTGTYPTQCHHDEKILSI